jgi:hypothetical protein
LGDEQALAVFGEQHEVGFPMAWGGTIGDIAGSFADPRFTAELAITLSHRNNTIAGVALVL